MTRLSIQMPLARGDRAQWGVPVVSDLLTCAR
jgi:hypothetical protein